MSTLLAMVLGGVAALWFSQVNAKPLRSLASLLSSQQTGQAQSERKGRGCSGTNPFSVLNSSVRRLITNTQSLQGRLSEQKLIIHDMFYYRLLKEGFESRPEMQAMKRFLDVPEISGLHGVAILNFLREQEIVDEQTLRELKGLKILLLDSLRQESSHPKS